MPNVERFVRERSARLRRALGRDEPRAFGLEPARTILIRYSNADDEAALARLAALDSRRLPKGSFLLGEIDGELVAAAPLDVDEELLKDPFRRTANIRELLRLQSSHVRRHRDALARQADAAAHRASGHRVREVKPARSSSPE